MPTPFEPVVVRPPAAMRRAVINVAFAIAASAPVVVALVEDSPYRWYRLFLVPIVVALGYAAARLVALRVRVADDGLREAAPFRLTRHTPWSDVVGVRAVTTAARVPVRGVEVTLRGGERRVLPALTMKATAAYADQQVDSWVATLQAARRAPRSA